MIDAYEPVEIRSRPQVDDDGNLTDPGEDTRTVICRVQPLILSTDITVDQEGTSAKLRVFAPAGTTVDENSEVKIRGEWYQVMEPPHNYATYRRPAVRRHRPSTVFTCERSEG